MTSSESIANLRDALVIFTRYLESAKPTQEEAQLYFELVQEQYKTLKLSFKYTERIAAGNRQIALSSSLLQRLPHSRLQKSTPSPLLPHSKKAKKDPGEALSPFYQHAEPSRPPPLPARGTRAAARRARAMSADPVLDDDDYQNATQTSLF
jgi:hypothetical protein